MDEINQRVMTLNMLISSCVPSCALMSVVSELLVLLLYDDGLLVKAVR